MEKRQHGERGSTFIKCMQGLSYITMLVCLDAAQSGSRGELAPRAQWAGKSLVESTALTLGWMGGSIVCDGQRGEGDD